jgi:uncharacterized protein YmfQ (DUF2313 family)
MAVELFTNHTIEQHRQALADFLPQGQAFGTKNIPDKNMFEFLMGLAKEFMRIENTINTIASQDDIQTTTLLIEQWERAVGIPDSCFSNTVSLEQRRTQVLLKLSVKADTRQSFIDIAAMFGYTPCIITNGTATGVYPLHYPWPYFANITEAAFTMYVDFPASKTNVVYPFTTAKYPWPYSDGVNNPVECFFNKIKMANVNIIYRYIL